MPLNRDVGSIINVHHFNLSAVMGRPLLGTLSLAQWGLNPLLLINWSSILPWIRNTSHLNGKKLSTNSSWDFEYVLETMNDYWVGPDENSYSESTGTR